MQKFVRRTRVCRHRRSPHSNKRDAYIQLCKPTPQRFYVHSCIRIRYVILLRKRMMCFWRESKLGMRFQRAVSKVRKRTALYRFKPRFSVLSCTRFICIFLYSKVRGLCRLGRKIFVCYCFVFPIHVCVVFNSFWFKMSSRIKLYSLCMCVLFNNKVIRRWFLYYRTQTTFDIYA